MVACVSGMQRGVSLGTCLGVGTYWPVGNWI